MQPSNPLELFHKMPVAHSKPLPSGGYGSFRLCEKQPERFGTKLMSLASVKNKSMVRHHAWRERVLLEYMTHQPDLNRYIPKLVEASVVSFGNGDGEVRLKQERIIGWRLCDWCWDYDEEVYNGSTGKYERMTSGSSMQGKPGWHRPPAALNAPERTPAVAHGICVRLIEMFALLHHKYGI